MLSVELQMRCREAAALGLQSLSGMLAMELLEPRRLADGPPWPLHAVERRTPSPGPGELLLRVRACAVCRTDLQICEGDLAARRLPIVPGHQVIGEVVARGEGTDSRSFGVGDRVGVGWLAWTCGTCGRCLEGRENLCERARFTGWDRDGGYATAMTVDAGFALRLPASFDDATAAPLLCGGVIGYRALKVSGVRPGQRLGLYGFGASALLAMQVALHWGCRVFVATRSVRERQRALDLGAFWAGGYDETPPEPLDAAVTFAPVGSVVVAALRALDRGGAVAINAIHLDEIPAFDYDHLWWERSLRSVSNYTRQDARELLALAEEIPIRPAVEIDPLVRANEVLARLREGHVSGAAVLTGRA